MTPDSPLYLFILILGFVVGACVGSFLNVMGLRLLKEESFVQEPSHCPHCKTHLRWFENIPVLSWLMLRAKCRTCNEPISLQYPLVEFLTAALFAAILWQFGTGLDAGFPASLYVIGTCLFLMFLVSNLMVIIITDWRESLIYTINSLSLVPAGLLYNALMLGPNQGTTPWDLGALVIHVPNGLIDALLGVLAAIVIFEGLILFSKLVFGTEGFGHGDTHLMMGVGAYLGWKLCIVAIFLGFIVQTIPSIPILVIQWVRNKQYVSLISGGIGAIFGLLPLVLTNFPAINNDAGTFAAVSLGCMVISLIALFVFLKNVRQTESFTYLPLGPALVIASLICLFGGGSLLGMLLGKG